MTEQLIRQRISFFGMVRILAVLMILTGMIHIGGGPVGGQKMKAKPR